MRLFGIASLGRDGTSVASNPITKIFEAISKSPNPRLCRNIDSILTATGETDFALSCVFYIKKLVEVSDIENFFNYRATVHNGNFCPVATRMFTKQ